MWRQFIKSIHFKNDDYVIGSGISKSLYDFVKIIFKEAEIPIKKFKGVQQI